MTPPRGTAQLPAAGGPQEPVTAPIPEAHADGGRNRSHYVIIGVILLAVIVSVGALIVIFSGKRGSSAASSAPSAATATRADSTAPQAPKSSRSPDAPVAECAAGKARFTVTSITHEGDGKNLRLVGEVTAPHCPSGEVVGGDTLHVVVKQDGQTVADGDFEIRNHPIVIPDATTPVRLTLEFDASQVCKATKPEASAATADLLYRTPPLAAPTTVSAAEHNPAVLKSVVLGASSGGSGQSPQVGNCATG